MWCTDKESEFLLSHLNQKQKVLEYGSGDSTAIIDGKVGLLISIEHDPGWFDVIKGIYFMNTHVILKKPTFPVVKPKDGTYEQFKDYIEEPLKSAPFDLIYIDGRARVGCASICSKLGHKDTLVFMHDFERPEYQPALKYLKLIKQVERMAKFTIL